MAAEARSLSAPSRLTALGERPGTGLARARLKTQRWRGRPRAPDWSASRQPDMQTPSRMGKGGELARPPVIRLFDSLRAGWPGPAPAPPPRARALALPQAWRRSLARPGSPGSVSKSLLPTAVSGAVCLQPHAWQRFSHAGEDSRPAFSGRGRKRIPKGGRRGRATLPAAWLVFTQTPSEAHQGVSGERRRSACP